MTVLETNQFLGTTAMEFQKKYCQEALDYDAFQRACIVFMEKAETLDSAPASGLRFFARIYGLSRLHLRGKLAGDIIQYYGDVVKDGSKDFVHEYPYTAESLNAASDQHTLVTELLDEVGDSIARGLCHMYYIQGYTVREIAERTGQSKSLVASKLVDYVAQIRHALKERGEL